MTEFDEMEEAYSDSEQDTDDEVMLNSLKLLMSDLPNRN